MSTGGGEFVFYHYTPSVVAGSIFTALFFASAAWHTKQLVSARVWYFIPFVIGCLFEAVGYLGRILSWAERPDYTKNPYIIQSLLLLLAPALFAASIYMILGRLIVRLEGDAYSIIRPRWLTKFFILGDVLSFCAQGGGGGMMATAKSQDDTRRAEQIILGGLGIQILFFGFFIIVSFIFHLRIRRKPTRQSYSMTTPWKGLLYVLYASSILIMIRSVFRIIEYVMGSDGELLSKEVYLYIFDAVPMFAVCVMFNWFHPSRVISKDDREPIASVTSLEVLGSDPEAARRKSMQWSAPPQSGHSQGPPQTGYSQHQQGYSQGYDQGYSQGHSSAGYR